MLIVDTRLNVSIDGEDHFVMKIIDEYLEFLYGEENNVKKKINVAGGVIIKEGENGETMVLLIQRAHDDFFPDHFEIPRGKCDKPIGEDLIHCLIREVKEETGLDIEPIKFIDKFSYLADKGTRESIQHNYLCKMKDPNQKVKLSKEHQDFKWVQTVGEVELFVLPEIKKTISKVLNQDAKIVEYPENEEPEKIREK